MALPRLDRHLSVYWVAPMRNATAALRRRRPEIPILMYHSVSDDPETGVGPYYRLATPPALFRDHLSILDDAGYSVVSLREAVAALGRPTPSPVKHAVITFDDGFRDFLTDAWPALARRSFGATVFLPTQYIDAPRRSFAGRECLEWSEVLELRRAGIDFGSHTVSHPKLEQLSETDLEGELARSRDCLEQRLSEKVDLFCHPYAFPAGNRAYVERFRATLLRTGYSIATTTNVGRADERSDPLMLPRLPVNGADDRRLFAAKLDGAYDWIARPQSLLKRVRRLVRRVS